MSRAFPAACVAHVVTAQTIPPAVVPTATVLSKGVAPSTGVVLLDEDTAVYIPNAAADLETTLQQVIAALAQTKTAIDKIADTLTAIGGGMTGSTTAPPPTLATNVTDIAAASAQILVAKTALETLKVALK